MEESVISNHFHKIYTLQEAKCLNPLTLAYIGDEVFSFYVRKFLVGSGINNVYHLTKISSQYVKANAQANMIEYLSPSLTEDESAIVKRGRNAKSTPPKNANKMDYKYATGAEALMGYLELTGQQERLEKLMLQGLAFLSPESHHPRETIVRSKKAH